MNEKTPKTRKKLSARVVRAMETLPEDIRQGLEERGLPAEELQEMQLHWKRMTRVEKLAMYRSVNTLIETRGSDIDVPAAVQTANLASFAVVDAAFLKVQDKYLVNQKDRLACTKAFANHDAFLESFKNRYCLIPPCEWADLESIGLIKNNPDRKAKGTPKATCYPTGSNGGEGQLTITGHKAKDSLDDPPGTDKGMVVRYQERAFSDPYQGDQTKFTRMGLSGGMSVLLDYGAESVGMVVDVSIAFKNGSGQTGPFCTPRTFVLS
jgi:hypothetical protein